MLSNTGLTDGMVGATRAGVINQQLLVDIQGMVLGLGVCLQDIQAFLEQDLARLAISAATQANSHQLPAPDSAIVSTRLVGRYPFWPCVIFIALLLVSGAFPLGIGIAATLMWTERIGLSGKKEASGDSLAALELTKARLTGVTTVAAELFHAAEDEARNDPGQEESPRSYVSWTASHEMVCIGLYERADSQVVVGFWRRNGRARENADTEE